MTSICFVGCVKAKLGYVTAAENLYTSDLFKKSRRLASTSFDRWYILSAKYGLLEPQRHIEPYDVTLSSMNVMERRKWAASVLETILTFTDPKDRLVFLTGQRYHENLVNPLREHGYAVDLPLEGMSIGKRLQWLKAEIGSSSHG